MARRNLFRILFILGALSYDGLLIKL